VGLSKTQIAVQNDRRRIVAGMYLRRTPQAEIATAVGVDIRTVCRDLDHLRAIWAQELQANHVDQRGRDLAALDQLEKDAATQYLATKHMGWWDRVLQAQERRARLLGLDYKAPAPGSSPEQPLFVASVGYDINHWLEDPEIRHHIMEAHRLIELRSGDRGLVEGSVTGVE